MVGFIYNILISNFDDTASKIMRRMLVGPSWYSMSFSDGALQMHAFCVLIRSHSTYRKKIIF
jgi:hypothetical protein